MNTCESCGTQLGPDTHLCPFCGRALEDSPSNTEHSYISIQTEWAQNLWNNVEINELLENGEKVILLQSFERNLIEKSFSDLLVGTLYGLTIIFAIIIIFSTMKLTMGNLIFVVALSVILLLICSYPFFKGLNYYLKIKNNTKLHRKELKHYLEFRIFTDKRWIQKAYNNLSDYFLLSLEGIIQREGDIISINNYNLFFEYSNTEIYNLITIRVFLDNSENIESAFKLSEILVDFDKFENLLRDIEQNLRYHVQKKEDGSGIIRFLA